MDKMWAGRFSTALNPVAEDFNSSIRVDSKMYKQDIQGSLAHAAMLAKQGIISDADLAAITAGLGGILADIESGALPIDMAAEDIHMFIEGELTKRVGDAGKRLHTARSRNDQVATDTRLYLREQADVVSGKLKNLICVITDCGEKYADVIMPGYTHLQRAQPITFGHHLLAYGMMLSRDLGRVSDAVKRMNCSPLGCCALAGTTYPIDREYTAEALGFDSYALNSLDGVSDRDFCVELCAAMSLVMVHLSRFSEEIIQWSSWEFKFIDLSDEFSTGSSIMPQKKNPDMAELVRGKTGRVYGDLISLLTMLKGLPLAYNKDMQEDKEAVFHAVETVCACLDVFAPMLQTMTVREDNMLKAAGGGFINATDLADFLTKKGMPFRAAYKITGQIVAYCIEKGAALSDLTIDEYKSFDGLFDETLYDAIDLKNCVQRRTSAGGPGAESIKKQIKYLREIVK
ncbi:MAG: argininosuccinate lyase [Oscillospiraceae bacterium]|nr:argininosuccinate lyase [Oscillospiraceae bacterium]